MKKAITSAMILLSTMAGMAQNLSSLNNIGWKFINGDDAKYKLSITDDSGWQSVNLPHDWSIASSPFKINPTGGPGGYYKAGKGWYRAHLNIAPELAGQKILLYCEGIYMNSEIYINGKYAGGHQYGYSSFYVDITDKVLPGKDNVIAIKADNSQQKNCRWYSGSGIYRNIWLVSCPKVHLDLYDPFVYTKTLNNENATVCMEIKMVNETNKKQKCTLETADGKTSITLEPNSSKTISKEMTFSKDQYWSVENPVIQKQTVTLESAEGKCSREVKFGVRKFEYSAENGLSLNGKNIILNGACVHHDNGVLGAAAYKGAEQRKASLLVEAGFNAVRTSHNPPSSDFLDACDENGLIVIDEAFDGWREAKNPHDYSQIIDECWKDDLEKLILRDRSHPSVFCWSIGNEILERKSDSAVTLAHEMREHIRTMDPTRPVTQALASWDDDWAIYDPLAAEHDIIGYNYLIHKHADDHKRVPSRIIIQTESFPRDAYSNYAASRDNSYVLGDFEWTGIDYLGESGIGRYYYEGETEGESWMAEMFPWHGAYCGDIDIIGWRKPISHYRSILWNQNNENGESLYMAVREPDGYFGKVKTTMWSVWPTWESWSWPGHEGKDVEVEVSTRYPKVKLFLNDKLIGEKDVENCMAVFTVPYEPGKLRAEGIENGKVMGSTNLKTAGDPSQFMVNSEKWDKLHYVEIRLADEHNELCPNAENEIKFSISGNARILGTGTGDLKDTKAYTSTTRKAWKGRVLVVVDGSDFELSFSTTQNGAAIKNSIRDK